MAANVSSFSNKLTKSLSLKFNKPSLAVLPSFVYLEKVENRFGEAVLSREKARREESWETLEKASEIKEKVNGTIFGRVKGGFTVDLGGAIAFLPGSQVDVRPIRDTNSLMQVSQPFQIL